MSELTSRHLLPMLAAGQAQKEITHNEALTRIDGLLHGMIMSRSLSAPPATPVVGEFWLVAGSASGDWVGQSGKLALWTDGGWRFTPPTEGMLLWSRADQLFGWYDGTAWHWGDWPVTKITANGVQLVGAAGAAIANPTGGTTVDSQSRNAIVSILQLLRSHGLLQN
jgi:hypothetical protein